MAFSFVYKKHVICQPTESPIEQYSQFRARMLTVHVICDDRSSDDGCSEVVSILLQLQHGIGPERRPISFWDYILKQPVGGVTFQKLS